MSNYEPIMGVGCDGDTYGDFLLVICSVFNHASSVAKDSIVGRLFYRFGPD